MELLGQKAALYGKEYLKVPARYTTQTCNVCGFICKGEDNHRNGTNMNPAPTMKRDKCHFRYITFVMKTRSSDARYGGS
jgi:transposase